VAPLLPRPGHRLLRCPICRLGLYPRAGALACPNRHAFDLARDGYVNLLPGNRRRPAGGGDRPEQLRHRAAFLEAGHFDFIAAAIVARLRRLGSMSAGGPQHILDAGCGTGHHLARIAAALGPGITGLGLDISAAAARLAARQWRDIAFGVVDLWADWPVQNASVDFVVSIFAPRNFAETARVLRPGGWLALVFPGVNHLVELRHRYRLMGQHEDKAKHYAEAATRTIGPPAVTRIVRRPVLGADDVQDAVLMGPNARHWGLAALVAKTEPVAVTFDVTLLLARKQGGAPPQNSAHRRKGRHRFPAP
jgi:23S rRNA (guanine745-N1)-methyltransferase